MKTKQETEEKDLFQAKIFAVLNSSFTWHGYKLWKIKRLLSKEKSPSAGGIWAILAHRPFRDAELREIAEVHKEKFQPDPKLEILAFDVCQLERYLSYVEHLRGKKFREDFADVRFCDETKKYIIEKFKDGSLYAPYRGYEAYYFETLFFPVLKKLLIYPGFAARIVGNQLGSAKLTNAFLLADTPLKTKLKRLCSIYDEGANQKTRQIIRKDERLLKAVLVNEKVNKTLREKVVTQKVLEENKAYFRHLLRQGKFECDWLSYCNPMVLFDLKNDADIAEMGTLLTNYATLERKFFRSVRNNPIFTTCVLEKLFKDESSEDEVLYLSKVRFKNYKQVQIIVELFKAGKLPERLYQNTARIVIDSYVYLLPLVKEGIKLPDEWVYELCKQRPEEAEEYFEKHGIKFEGFRKFLR